LSILIFPNRFSIWVISIYPISLIDFSSVCVWNAGFSVEIRIDDVTPFASMFCLVFQPFLDTLETGFIHFAFERLPFLQQLTRLFRAFKMGVIDVLDDSLAGFQFVCIRHMVEEQ